MNVAGAVSFAVRADDVRASTGCARCGTSGPTREVNLARRPVVDKSWLRAHSGAVVGIDALADTFTLGATSPEILARVLPGGPPYRPEPPDPALRRAGETVGRLGNPIDRLQEEILAPPRHQKVPGWVFIVLGLGPIIGAYPYAQEVRHGGRIKVVLLPFYWLGGKWGVFGALLAMGLLFVAIGARRYLHAFRQPPTRQP